MRPAAYRLASLLSILAMALAFIPVLLPAVCVLAALVAVLVLGSTAGPQTEVKTLWSQVWGGSGSRPFRRSIRAVAISAILYGLLWVHSELFYVGPLKRDQEPFRKDAVEQLKEHSAPGGRLGPADAWPHQRGKM